MHIILAFFATYWRSWVVFLAPLVLLPVILENQQGDPAYKCLYIFAVMSIYWLTEAIALPVTALLPLVLLPLMDVHSTGDVCLQYFKDVVFMFLVSAVLATAALNVNLHKRIAFRLLLCVGCTASRLGIGLMLSSMLLSFLCNSTVTTTIMVPIGLELLHELREQKIVAMYEGQKIVRFVIPEPKTEVEEQPGAAAAPMFTSCFSTTEDDDEDDDYVEPSIMEPDTVPVPTNITNLFMISIAYGASIGGSGTIVGSIANFAYKGIFEQFFKKSQGISYGTFMLYGVPVALLSACLVCLWLHFLFSKGLYTDVASAGKAKEWIQNQRSQLGPMSAKEIFISMIFVSVLVTWLARDMGVVSGWSVWFEKVNVSNATPGMVAVVLMFVIPGNWTVFNFCRKREWPANNSFGLVTWKVIDERVPWGMIFLLGSGFAMTYSIQKTKLTQKIGESLGGLKDQSGYSLMVVACLISQILGTLSNAPAVACIVLPVFAQVAITAGIHPVFIMFPATMCISHAFLLPNNGSPNSVIANEALVRTNVLLKAGSVPFLITFGVVVGTFYVYGGVFYKNFDSLPDFAK